MIQFDLYAIMLIFIYVSSTQYTIHLRSIVM